MNAKNSTTGCSVFVPLVFQIPAGKVFLVGFSGPISSQGVWKPRVRSPWVFFSFNVQLTCLLVRFDSCVLRIRRGSEVRDTHMLTKNTSITKTWKTLWCHVVPGAFGYCIPLPCSPKMPVSDIRTNIHIYIHIYIYILYIYIYIWIGICTYTYILLSSAKKLVECGRHQKS